MTTPPIYASTRPSKSTHPLGGIVAICLVLAAVAAVSVFMTAPGFAARAPIHLAWYALAGAFALTEAFSIHIEIGENAHSFSLNEIPMVIGLFCCRPWEVVAARVVGGVAVHLYRHRRALPKLAFNGCLFAFESAVACLIFRRMGGAGSSITGSSLAALAATTVTGVVGAGATAAAIASSGGPALGRIAPRMLAVGAVAPAATTSLGLAGIVLVSVDRSSAWLVAVLATVLFGAYRAYAALRQRYANLSQFYEFTQVLSRSPELEGAIRATLGQACQVMRAARAELYLHGKDGAGPLKIGFRDGQLEAMAITRDDPDRISALVAARGRPAVIRRGTRDPVERACADRRAAKDMIVVSLAHAGRSVGILAVMDRLGSVSTFDREDAKVFATLANHASVSIENARLIDQLRVEASEKEHQALHDSLTGLGNRNLFTQRTEEALSAMKGTGSLAVMLLDLNRFKDINDTLGHHCGDLVLQEVARRLQIALPASATITRLGGDEFAVLLPGLGEADAGLAGLAVVEQLARPFVADELEIAIAAAVGLALSPQHGTDASSLLQRADIAMYRAKEAHDNDVVIYGAENDESSSVRRLTVAAQIRHAISRRELSLYYQPKASLSTGAVVGVEALLRWHHPELGSVPPDEFIPVAENVGYIQALTTFVLNQALGQCASWYHEGLHVGMAVNLSARSLVDLSLPQEIAGLLASHRLPASMLTLEMTESQLMVDTARTLQVLDALHELGVRISIDDFGTGYSSLSYLNRLPVDEVKIDKSFVLRLGDDPHDTAIVRSVIDLGRNLGLRIVAEGVEDETTWDLLAGLGCDVAQGFLVSRAVPAAELREWLLARETAAL